MSVQFDEDKQNKKLELLRKKEEEDLARLLSAKYGVQYADLSRLSINTDGLRIIPEKTARSVGLAIFDKVGKKINVAVLSPQNQKTINIIEDLKDDGLVPTIFMVSKASLDKAFSRYEDLSFATKTKAGSLDISNEDTRAYLQKIGKIEDVFELLQQAMAGKSGIHTSRVFEIILAGALSLKASDIHIEPEESYTRLRYRLDGVLTDVMQINLNVYKLLLSRIKLLSGLKLNVKDNAQDGRFSVTIDEVDIEIRTSALPGAYGESIVMRVLNPETIGVEMEQLGIEKKLLDILNKEIKKPNGMILNTGPTGSGKTTSLYAFLKKVHKPGIKIITIEDPIEYHLPGIVQTQTDKKKGYDFLQGLRSALRQDPDIIMVGEVRDSETAKIAVNSALTGHLVFSTLHTNSAAGAFPRLIDLGVDPKIINSAVNVIIAQRLVRRLKPEHKKEVKLEGAQKARVDEILNSIVDKSLVPENTEIVWEPSEKDPISYKGRIGLFEAIVIDEKIDALVRQSASEKEIQEAARPQGILTMLQDGVLKALNGVTSLSEVDRVIGLS